MVRRKYGDRDGTCFAVSVFNECLAMGEYDEHCGTYKCPFYKPFGCKDWIRADDENGVSMYAPEEVVYEKRSKEKEDKQ